jgi:hypothetical protein
MWAHVSCVQLSSEAGGAAWTCSQLRKARWAADLNRVALLHAWRPLLVRAHKLQSGLPLSGPGVGAAAA